MKQSPKVARAFHEVFTNEPAIVATTRKKKGPTQARKQKVAIALSKARAAGADIPMRSRPSGSGPVKDKDIGKGYMHMGKC